MMISLRESGTSRGFETRGRVILMFLLGFVLTSGAWGQDFDSIRDVPVEFLASAGGIPQGQSIDLAIVFHVPPDHHITSLETGLFYVDFDSATGLTFGEVVFPRGKIWQGDEVYSGDVIVRSTVAATSDARPGPRTIEATVGYQVCSETGAMQCYFPVERSLTLATEVLPAGTAPALLNQSVFPSQPTSAAPNGGSGLAGLVESALERGSILAFFLVFVGGILTSFTPCVYPIIPITISYIGGRSEGKKFRGFFLSLFFVLGLSIMYSSLGVIAALTGGVFGGLTQHPLVYGVLIAIFVVMGISMMGAFDIQLPASWQGKLQSGQRKGVIGAILMGLASGLIAAPCVGPVLVALLSWVAKTGSVVMGFSLLMSFSLGLGLLFVVIGTFAGAVAALPKAGGWMEGVKHFFGWLLWATALYFAGFIVPHRHMPLLWGAFLVLLGTYVGAFRPFSDAGEWRWVLKKWVGILSIVAGVFFFLFGLSQIVGWQVAATQGAVQAAESSPDWIVNDFQGAFKQAADQGKPIMMDFYADWCLACVELDEKTYNQPGILSRSKEFVSLKMDFTRQNDWTQEMTKKYGIKGLPTVVFLTSQGVEVERFFGYRNAADLAKIMDRVVAADRRI